MMKAGSQKKLTVMVDSLCELKWDNKLYANNKLIFMKMKEFFDCVSIKNARYSGDYEVDIDRIEFDHLNIYDLAQYEYDIFITSYSGYSGKDGYFGSQKIIQEAADNPAKIYLLLLDIPETVTIELAFECLPDEDACLPGNIFFNWDDFLRQLRSLCDLLDSTRQTDAAEEILKDFDDMPLLLRSLILNPGSGKNFYGDFKYGRWDAYFAALEQNKVPLSDSCMLRSLIFSGSHGKKYLRSRFLQPQDGDDFVAELESRYSASVTEEELVDLVAALDLISGGLDACLGFRTRAASSICRFANSFPMGDGMNTIYEAFVLDRYKCFKHLSFVAEIAAADASENQGSPSVCKLVKTCNLLDPWEKFATLLQDVDTVTTLFAEKLQEWLVLMEVAAKFHDTLLGFLKEGTDREKVESISWRITRRMMDKFSDMRANEEVHVSHVLKKTLVDGKACFSFFHVFLAEFQVDRYPELHRRLQFLWIKLYVAEVMEKLSEDYVLKSQYCNFIDFFAESPQDLIPWLTNELETGSIPGDVSDVVRYVVFEAPNFDFDKCLNILNALINFINEDQQRVETFYKIIEAINKNLPGKNHQALMQMVGGIPPNDKVIGTMKKNNRKRIRDIAEVLELGKKTSSSGALLDEYMRGHDKNEFMDLVHEQLSAVKIQN